MHLPGQTDAADMLKFVSGQLSHALVQSLDDPAGVLLFCLRVVEHRRVTSMSDTRQLVKVFWGGHVNTLTFMPLLSTTSAVVGDV